MQVMTEDRNCKKCGHYKIRHKLITENDNTWSKGSFLSPYVHSWGQCSECSCDKFK